MWNTASWPATRSRSAKGSAQTMSTAAAHTAAASHCFFVLGVKAFSMLFPRQAAAEAESAGAEEAGSEVPPMGAGAAGRGCSAPLESSRRRLWPSKPPQMPM